MLGAGLILALRLLSLSPFRSSLYVPPCCNGGRVREDAAGVRASGFRLWSGPRLAGESAAEALPGLEEAEVARQAGDNSEEAGPGLSARGGPSPPGPHSPSPTRPGSACRRWIKSTGKKAFLLALYESIFKIKRLNNLESFPSSQRK